MGAIRKVRTGTLQTATGAVLSVDVVPEVALVDGQLKETPQIMAVFLSTDDELFVSGRQVRDGDLIIAGNNLLNTNGNTGASVFNSNLTITGRNAEKYSLDGDGNLIYTY